MSRTNPKAIIIFARNPVPGEVKTRLQSKWDADTVCRIYEAFLEDARLQLMELENVDCFVSIHSSQGADYFDRFKSCGFNVVEQEGVDLGQRMHQAFAKRFSEGYENVVIIGSDSPTLPIEYLRTALESRSDLVLGPSTDGGYYLIGMSGNVTDVFEGVDWGTDRVLFSTLEKVKECGASLTLLPPWYDVDTPQDLLFLETHLGLMEHAGLKGGKTTKSVIEKLNL
ncbi:MAG: glycosyltransferase [Candidatus Nitronauta litoralis]|uniref:Glycosyltransferase n=1 Tax=Candidatus Nitronauta litoralis TaxID=2705533 RepID=A0A7T0BXL0_9BACT|nr:MAG: glycosyltransferase [Candidatus Nitronauta litoralis]